MSTKQLWNVLMLNTVTQSYFHGIYPAGMLKDITVKCQVIISSTGPSYKDGEHWLLLFFEGNSVEFCDL